MQNDHQDYDNDIMFGNKEFLEKAFLKHRFDEQIAQQINLLEDLSKLSMSKQKQLAKLAQKKIGEIIRLAKDNDIDIIESLSNYFKMTADNIIFEHIKHLEEDVSRGLEE